MSSSITSRVYTYNIKITSPIPAEKLKRAFITDYINLIPRIASKIIQRIQIVQGDGGPQSINKIIFAPGQKYKYAKVEVLILDEEKFFVKFVVIEGDVLGEEISKMEVEKKIEVPPEGKTILNVNFVYHTKGDTPLSNERVEAVNQSFLALYKAVEEYFLEYPNL